MIPTNVHERRHHEALRSLELITQSRSGTHSPPVVAKEYQSTRHSSDDELEDTEQQRHFLTHKPVVRAQEKIDKLEDEELHLSSDLRTFINTIIAFVGAGVLGLPFAFKEGGLFMSALVVTAVAAVCLYCMLLLVECKRMLASECAKTYSDVCRLTLGTSGLVTVEASLCITQSGFSTAYLIFISKNLNNLFNAPKNPVVFCLLPLLVPVCLLKHLKYLAPFSLLAEVVNGVGLAVVYFTDFEYLSMDHPEIKKWNLNALPFVIGVATYAFEGMGMILPLENNMQDRSRFPALLTLVVVLYTLLCVSMGAYGYRAFGEATEDIILLNMTGLTANIVKLSFCVGLFFTYPIMMVPVWEVLELKWLDSKASTYERYRNVIRTLLVILTGIVACFIPNFGVFISLIGSSCCSLLAFVLPPLCHLSLMQRDDPHNASSKLQNLFHLLIIVGGVWSGIVGTAQAISNL